jgi:hypothetical protein
MYSGIKALQEYSKHNPEVIKKVHDSSHTHNLLPGLILALYDNKYSGFFTLPNTISPQVFTQTSKDRIISGEDYKQFWEFLPADLLVLFKDACKDIESIVLNHTKDFMTFGKNIVMLLSSSTYGSTEIPVHLHKTVLRPVVRKCLTVHVPLVESTLHANKFVVYPLIDAHKIRDENLIHGENLAKHLEDKLPILEALMPSTALNIMYFSGAQMPHKVDYGDGVDLFFIFEDVEYTIANSQQSYPSVETLSYDN